MNLFLDLYPTGKIEYDEETKDGLRRAKARVGLGKIEALKMIISDSDFQNVKSTYDSIFSLRDEVFVIKLEISNEGVSKTIIIKNYMPTHPDASARYPGLLMKFIDELEKLRPKSVAGDGDFVLKVPY